MNGHASNVVNGIDLRRHLGLAGMAVKRYRWAIGASLDEDDLMQAALMGLTRAAQKFEPERGFAFSTYAAHWCRCFVARLIANEGRTVRVPIHLRERLLRESKSLPCPTVSIDASGVGGGDEPTGSLLDRLVSDDVSPEDAATYAQRAERLRALVDALPPRLRQVMRARLDDSTLREIGGQLGVSRERVRQLQGDALGRLRQLAAREGRAK